MPHTERGGLPLSRHWWAGFKPFMEMGRAVRALLPSGHGHEPTGYAADLQHLAKMYDYVVREFDPPRRGAGALLPRCVRSSRQLRRALEHHAHFDEIHHIWQEHHWRGDGYAAWATMPGEPLLGRGS